MANVTLGASGGTEEQTTPFIEALLKKLSEAEDHKPGAVVRLVQPLLLAHPLESMEPEGEGVACTLYCICIIIIMHGVFQCLYLLYGKGSMRVSGYYHYEQCN